MLYYRSHINLHLHACQNRAMECKVPGCKRMMLRRDYGSHILDAVQSHHTLQDAEIQCLRRVINDKVTLPSIALLAVSPNLFYLAITTVLANADNAHPILNRIRRIRKDTKDTVTETRITIGNEHKLTINN